MTLRVRAVITNRTDHVEYLQTATSKPSRSMIPSFLPRLSLVLRLTDPVDMDKRRCP